MKKYYDIPYEYWQRIHFVRPRFKANIENVLLYMANECCKIKPCSRSEYSKLFYDAIKSFPGNLDSTKKTLDNWRTEIPALFGFYKEDKKSDRTETSQMAFFLNENQDLTQFFKLFLFTFQFPGGHLKPHEVTELIKQNIRFKPAKKILEVLLAGNAILSEKSKDKEMSISAEEATYCIFNDTRVTSGSVEAQDIAGNILYNRSQKIKYYNQNDIKIFNSKGTPRSKGDIVRYAGDILDYMVIASLLVKRNEYYYLKGNEVSAINTFVNDNTFFKGYEPYYGRKEFKSSQISEIEPLWYDYVNDNLNPDLFKTDIHTLFKKKDEIQVIFDKKIMDIIDNDESTTKDIGNVGEALIYGHEMMRLKKCGYEGFMKMIQIVDSPSYHPGFDIDSFEGDGTQCHRYIEVKTTISKKPVQVYNFHMSTNEWSVAETNREHYYIYRLMLSADSKVLYILPNPVALYKNDKISAIPRNGMEVSFKNDDFTETELLIWKD